MSLLLLIYMIRKYFLSALCEQVLKIVSVMVWKKALVWCGMSLFDIDVWNISHLCFSTVCGLSFVLTLAENPCRKCLVPFQHNRSCGLFIVNGLLLYLQNGKKDDMNSIVLFTHTLFQLFKVSSRILKRSIWTVPPNYFFRRGIENIYDSYDPFMQMRTIGVLAEELFCKFAIALSIIES